MGVEMLRGVYTERSECAQQDRVGCVGCLVTPFTSFRASSERSEGSGSLGFSLFSHLLVSFIPNGARAEHGRAAFAIRSMHDSHIVRQSDRLYAVARVPARTAWQPYSTAGPSSPPRYTCAGSRPASGQATHRQDCLPGYRRHCFPRRFPPHGSSLPMR